MEYNVVRNASNIINESKYIVKDPFKYKGKWNDLFPNPNKIYLELGTGRGDMIINMAIKYPNINFIGLEINENQIATAATKIGNSDIKNLKLIKADARDIDKFFGHEIDTITFTGVSYIEYYDENCTSDSIAPWGYIESDYGDTREFGPDMN